MPDFDYVVVKVNVNKDTLAKLKWLAAIRQKTVTDVLHQAISTECFLDAERRQGVKVILERPAGKFVEVVFSSD